MPAKKAGKIQSKIDDSAAIRSKYEKYGAKQYYSNFGAEYRNPHEPVIREALQQAVNRWKLDLSRALDLACGSGEATLALRELGCTRIDAADPHTGEAFFERTGQAAEPISFEMICDGALFGRHYSLIVCSFAMHLVDKSRLPALLAQLAMISNRLLILTPHKRPEIRSEWGWMLEADLIVKRVRARLYAKMD